MTGNGRISVLVSKDLQTLLSAVRTLPAEVNKQIRTHTRTEAEPIWQEEVRGNVMTALEAHVLSDTARVSVSDQNVMLKSGGIGKTNGTPNSVLVFAVEHGADPNKVIQSASRKGTPYKRRRGRQFRLPRSRGYVVWPAAGEIIPRLASLWAQIAIRTTHETFEKGGAN